MIQVESELHQLHQQLAAQCDKLTMTEKALAEAQVSERRAHATLTSALAAAAEEPASLLSSISGTTLSGDGSVTESDTSIVSKSSALGGGPIAPADVSSLERSVMQHSDDALAQTVQEARAVRAAKQVCCGSPLVSLNSVDSLIWWTGQVYLHVATSSSLFAGGAISAPASHRSSAR